MSNQDDFNRWRALIAKNSSSRVLEELQRTAKKSELLSEVIQQKARTRALQERIIKGVISYEEERQTEDELRQDLLALIDAIESGAAADPNLAREIAKVSIAGAVRNAAINSTLRANEIHIGDRTIIRQARREIGRFLTPAPFVPEVLVGREELLVSLHRRLKAPDQPSVTLLHGAGGIGKSSVAAAYCHRFSGDYDHVGWLFADTGVADALLRLAPGLNVTFSAEDKDQEAMLDHVLRALANLGGNCLLLLDNVNDREDLEKHFHRLAGLSNFRVVLTSRLGDFPNTTAYPVNALTEGAARTLFARRYRTLTEEEAALFPEVYVAVGGNTLVLDLLAKNLKRVNALRPTKYLLSDLVADLQEKGILGLRESKAVSTLYGGKLQKAEVGDLVNAMYTLDELAEEELFLLTVFSVLPADKIPFDHLELLAGQLADIEEPLLGLAARGWVEWDEEGGSFRCSPVVQEVVRVRQKDWVDELRPVFVTLSEQFTVHSGVHFLRHNLETVAPFASYVTSIINHLKAQNDNTLLLYINLANYYQMRGNLRYAQHILRVALRLIKHVQEINPGYDVMIDRARLVYSCLGDVSLLLKEFPAAADYFTEHLALLSSLISKKYSDEISLLSGKVAALIRLGNAHAKQTPLALQKVESCFQEALALAEDMYQKTPDSFRVQEVYTNALSWVGDLRMYQQQFPEALRVYQQMQEVQEVFLRQIASKEIRFRTRAVTARQLGKTSYQNNDLDAAVAYLQSMQQLATAAVQENPENIWNREILAGAWTLLADLSPIVAEKVSYANKSLAIWAEIIEQAPDYAPAEEHYRVLKADIERITLSS